MLRFFLLAFVLSWVIVPFTGELNPTGPLLAAAICAAASGGRAEVGRWLRNSVALRGQPRWYLYAVLIVVGLNTSAMGLALAFGVPAPTGDDLRAWPELLVVFPAYLLVIGVGEEAGWRGWAMPALTERHGPMAATMILGAVIAAWHLPLVLLGAQFPVILVAVAASQFLFTWLQQQTDGSVPVVMVAHAAQGGLAGAYFGPMLSGSDEALELSFLAALLVGVAAMVLVADGRRRAAARAA
jgi:uncharacterized protein